MIRAVTPFPAGPPDQPQTQPPDLSSSPPSDGPQAQPPHGMGGRTAGLLAASVALLILLAGQVLSGAPGVLEIIANGVTRFIPLDWFEAGLSAFGPLAKGLLFAAVCGGVLVLGAILGWLVGRPGDEAPTGAGRAALIGLVPLLLVEVLVLPLADVGFFGLELASSFWALQVPLLLACLAYGLVLAGLLRASVGAATGGAVASVDGDREERAARGGTGAATTRRGFLGRTLALLGLGALAVSSAVVGARILGVTRGSGSNDAVVGGGGVDADGFAVEEAQSIRMADGEIVTGSAAGYFGPTAAATPIARFYVVGKDLVSPVIDAETWRLSVEGLVDTPRSLSLDDLRGLPAVEAFRTLQCISSPVLQWSRLIGNQRWQGTRVSNVLDLAGVRPEARFVLWRSADGFTESLPLEIALDEDTLLVYEMGDAGTPLPDDHGGPLRVLIAGRYGMKQPKWLEAIALSDTDEPGYWVRRGWDEQAIVRTYSRIDWPRKGMSVPSDRPFPVYGVANAGDRGIKRVELTVDEVSWLPVELEPLDDALGTNTWRRWRAELRAPGERGFSIRARAIDGLGQVQDAEVRPPLPSGATGLHAVALLGESGIAVPLPANHPDV